MGDVNQLLFVKRHAAEFTGPYLEVGARDYGSTQDLRSLFAKGDAYVGVDMSEGSGVDVVLDLTAPPAEIDTRLDHARYGTIFCLSVLEHCRQPFVMAENLTRLLKPGGRVCVSVPFAWKYHGYPSDYWRFTPEGVKLLFPRLLFDPAQCAAATSVAGQFRPLDRTLAKIAFRSTPHRRAGYPLRGITARTMRLLSKVGVLRWLAGYPYVLAPTNVLMIGTLPER